MNYSTHSTGTYIHHLQKSPSLLMRTAVLFICCFLLFLPSTLQATNSQKNVAIVYLQDKGFSQKLIKHLEKDIKEKNFNVIKITLQHALNTQLQEQDLIIALGSKVTKAIIESNINKPTLSLLIPKSFSDALEKKYPNTPNLSMLLIDQPINRHFYLISEILGKHHKTGLMLGPYTQQSEELFKQFAVESAQSLITRYIDQTDQLTSTLKVLSKEADVLLALPDPGIYNKRTIRGILLSSYRYKLPIIGFSKAYVKAGAIAAIYSSPEQISIQTANISSHFFNTYKFDEKIYYPSDFSISLNHKVARSMSIRLPESSAIAEQIKKSEKKP